MNGEVTNRECLSVLQRVPLQRVVLADPLKKDTSGSGSFPKQSAANFNRVDLIESNTAGMLEHTVSGLQFGMSNTKQDLQH